MDPIGIVPLFLSLTEGMNSRARRRAVILTMLTSLIGSLVFLFVGKGIFAFIGISVNDFKIAGGVILLLIALDMVLTGKEREEHWDRSVGVVPLGIPLIVGPALITTLLILTDTHTVHWVLAALLANLAILAFVLAYSRYISRILGVGGMTAFGKIIGLFLAAIAVMMIRVGIQGAFGL